MFLRLTIFPKTLVFKAAFKPKELSLKDRTDLANEKIFIRFSAGCSFGIC